MAREMNLPGPKSQKYIEKLRRLSAGYGHPYPFVHSGKGHGSYFWDIDGNKFLDFASQIASNPLGYNEPELQAVVRVCNRSHPIKYAGADFVVKEEIEFLETLTSVTPKTMNAAMLNNSGAEAVENCLKIAMRHQGAPKFGIAFNNAFHGRTLGALSCTKSKPIQKRSFLSVPMKHVSYDEDGLDRIKRIAAQNDPKDIGFVIIEPIQGEGGYNVASDKLMKGLRQVTKKHDIPFICDEVQSGMGRTGKWWAFEHHGITPDAFSAAKALQVGASVTRKNWVPEPNSLGSTWGGGQLLDMALGMKTIEIIKKRNLLKNIKRMGDYLLGSLKDVKHIQNIRGKGLMLAFDLDSKDHRDNFIIECLRQGLVVLGAGPQGVRLIPSFVVAEKEADHAISIIQSAALKTSDKKYKVKGKLCNYLTCGETHA